MKQLKTTGKKVGNALLDGALGEIVGPVLVVGLLLSVPVTTLAKRRPKRRDGGTRK